MASITSAGVGSGLDVEGIISGLMKAERVPLSAITTERSSTKSQISMFGLLKNSFGELKTAMDKLSKQAGLNPQSVNSTDDKLVSATASEKAAPGQYVVEVSQLAKAQSIAVAGEPSIDSVVGTGSLTITLGSFGGTPNAFTANADKTPVTINIDASNQTLGGIKDAINSANAGVSASIVNDGNGNRLVLTSKDTGANLGFKIDVTDDDTTNNDGAGLSKLAFDPSTSPVSSNNVQVLADAQNALFKVNNMSITKPSNTVTDAVEGLTLNLKSATTAPVTVNVSRDDTALKANLQAFVDAYNKIRGNLKDQQTKDSTLGKDTAPAALERGLRNTVRQSVNASGLTLSDLGFNFDKTGVLSLDQTKLNKTLATDPSALAKVFADTTVGGTTTPGLGKRTSEWIKSLSENGGVLDSKTDALNRRLRSLDDREAKFNVRLDSIEKRYRAQFTALDSMVASMQQTSSFLSQQLASLQSL